MKIRNKILFWLLPVVIFIGIATVVTLYHFFTKTVRQNVFDQLETVADELLEHIGLFVDGKRNRLIDFSSDGFIRDCTDKITNGIDVDSCTLKLNRHLLYNKQPLDTDIAEIFIVDLEGKVISSTEINRVGKDVSGEDYFSKTMKRGSHINDLHYNSEFKLNTFEISILLTGKDGKNVIGIIVIRYKGDSLRKVTRSGMTGELGGVEKLKWLGETGELYIVNSDKLMITGSRFIKGVILKQVVDTEGVRAAFDNEHGMIGIYPDYRGIRVLGVSRYLEKMEWVILAEKDVSEAFAPIARLRNISVIIEIVSVIIIVIITIVFAAGITRSVKSLVGFVNRMAKGDLTEQITVKSKDEIGYLAGSFDIMRVELGELLKDNKKAKEDWESTFDSVSDLIAIYDKDCTLVRCNKALLNRLNVKPEVIIGKSCHEIFRYDKDKYMAGCAVIETFKSLKTAAREEETSCLGGIFSILAFPHVSDKGEFLA